MEKCIVNPIHIELQILADSHGNCIHLYERDCSIQRRNQKLIEIAPSPQLDEAQRQYLGGLSVIAAKSVGYRGAGTVEFLQDESGRFYFMEMNTRVQVEHTISEAITGVDIVEEQIRIAAGLPLKFRQDQIQHRGYAIQFRVNAEDPKNDFLPSFGRISRYYAPGGPGVRTDTAIYTGYTIPPYYDSMIAKVIVWALTWDDVINRGQRALDDMVVHGIRTTKPYYQEILNHPDFRAAHFNTSFVENHPELTKYSDKRNKEDLAAALAVAIAAHAGL
jgi:pyruvate carboxylase subunit A